MVSSGDTGVGKPPVIALLFVCDGLRGVCLGLEYLAKQM